MFSLEIVNMTSGWSQKELTQMDTDLSKVTLGETSLTISTGTNHWGYLAMESLEFGIPSRVHSSRRVRKKSCTLERRRQRHLRLGSGWAILCLAWVCPQHSLGLNNGTLEGSAVQNSTPSSEPCDCIYSRASLLADDCLRLPQIPRILILVMASRQWSIVFLGTSHSLSKFVLECDNELPKGFKSL